MNAKKKKKILYIKIKPTIFSKIAHIKMLSRADDFCLQIVSPESFEIFRSFFEPVVFCFASTLSYLFDENGRLITRTSFKPTFCECQRNSTKNEDNNFANMTSENKNFPINVHINHSNNENSNLKSQTDSKNILKVKKITDERLGNLSFLSKYTNEANQTPVKNEIIDNIQTSNDSRSFETLKVKRIKRSKNSINVPENIKLCTHKLTCSPLFFIIDDMDSKFVPPKRCIIFSKSLFSPFPKAFINFTTTEKIYLLSQYVSVHNNNQKFTDDFLDLSNSRIFQKCRLKRVFDNLQDYLDSQDQISEKNSWKFQITKSNDVLRYHSNSQDQISEESNSKCDTSQISDGLKHHFNSNSRIIEETTLKSQIDATYNDSIFPNDAPIIKTSYGFSQKPQELALDLKKQTKNHLKGIKRTQASFFLDVEPSSCLEKNTDNNRFSKNSVTSILTAQDSLQNLQNCNKSACSSHVYSQIKRQFFPYIHLPVSLLLHSPKIPTFLPPYYFSILQVVSVNDTLCTIHLKILTMFSKLKKYSQKLKTDSNSSNSMYGKRHLKKSLKNDICEFKKDFGDHIDLYNDIMMFQDLSLTNTLFILNDLISMGFLKQRGSRYTRI